jgi:hypothetical protein
MQVNARAMLKVTLPSAYEGCRFRGNDEFSGERGFAREKHFPTAPILCSNMV